MATLPAGNYPDPKIVMHQYLDLGFMPFPWFIGRDGRKCPAISGFHYRDFSVSHADIDRWPKAQPGLVMSQRSGMWTLDFDCTWDRVQQFFSEFSPDRTAIQVTGRGYHFVYHGTGGCAWPRDGVWGADWLDVQVRSCGFVAAAPSIHPNGKRYYWSDWPVREPGTLFLNGRPERLPRPGGRGGSRTGGPDGDLKHYAEHGIEPGWQDSELYRLACVHVRSMPEQELFGWLWAAACASAQNLHNPWREADIMAKIRYAAGFTSEQDARERTMVQAALASGVFPVMAAVAGKRVIAVMSKKGAPQHQILMAIFWDNYYLAQTPDGDPFAVSLAAPGVMLPLKNSRGSSLRKRLAADMYYLTGFQPSQEALHVAIGTVEGTCLSAGKVPVALRAARNTDGHALLDLGRPDGARAVIRPGGWRLSLRGGVVFRRSALTRELPVPVEPGTGSAVAVRHLFNVGDGGDGAWAALVAFEVHAILYPHTTHAVSVFTADSSGALKTATMKHVKEWIDPGPFIPVPKDARSWAATAGNTLIPAIDNLNEGIPAWWSRLLCTGTSGDAWADRALYENNEPFTAQFYVAPLLSGIGVMAGRADLADRSIRYHLRQPRWYLDDTEAEDAWRRGHPAALGWLLDIASYVAWLHASGRVQRPRTGRMATFEWVLAAVDVVLRNNGAGMKWYKENRARGAADAVEADPLAAAITATITQPCAATTGELKAALDPVLEDEGREKWTTPKIGKRMPAAADALGKTGWHLERCKAGHQSRRPWEIYPPGTWTRREDGSVVVTATGLAAGGRLPSAPGVEYLPDGSLRFFGGEPVDEPDGR